MDPFSNTQAEGSSAPRKLSLSQVKASKKQQMRSRGLIVPEQPPVYIPQRYIGFQEIIPGSTNQYLATSGLAPCIGFACWLRPIG